MAAYGKEKVKLVTDLTKYNKTWLPGLIGYTIPGAKFTFWGSSDCFAGVQFENGTSGDILWKSLEKIKEETK